MKEIIKSKIQNPKELEKLFRLDPLSFRRDFNLIYPEVTNNQLAEFWNERLNFDNRSEISGNSKSELIFVIIASIISGLLANVPGIFQIDETSFYSRNMGFIAFLMTSVYFTWLGNLSFRKIFFVAAAFLISAIFINLFPVNDSSRTLILSCIHLPLFLWTILGFAFTGDRLFDFQKRMDFLRYNGDLIVISTIILSAGIALAAITQGLFSLIGLQIFDYYKPFVILPGLAAAPVVGTYVIRNNPQLVSRVSPVIARIFSPLVLLTLVIFLIAIIVTGKDPYNDREFLLTFNILLIVVMTIIVFSVAETSRLKRNRTEIVVLFLLSAVTVIVNCTALSAILFRINEWGITPNRLAVLGGNILILINLLLVSYKLLQTIFNKCETDDVEKIISKFLTVYCIWTVIVVFIFPLIFSFK
ncbi:MAG TPA: hypothetical protein PKC91_12985 [Ignavibacteria bacterium]|nr:hypothetical protein [Ignavibacteria bacterium]